MKKVVFLILLVFFIGACGKEENIPEYKKLMQENEYIIVDVRTKEEYEEKHIKEAIHIPYDEINEKTNLDKNKLLFVYCKSGNRSKQAYNKLKELGYRVYDLGALASIDLPKE